MDKQKHMVVLQMLVEGSCVVQSWQQISGQHMSVRVHRFCNITSSRFVEDPCSKH